MTPAHILQSQAALVFSIVQFLFSDGFPFPCGGTRAKCEPCTAVRDVRAWSTQLLSLVALRSWFAAV